MQSNQECSYCRCLNLAREPDESSGIRLVTKNKYYHNFVFNRCLMESYKNPLYFLIQTKITGVSFSKIKMSCHTSEVVNAGNLKFPY